MNGSAHSTVLGEIVHETLVRILMNIAVEHAEAERGLLILSREDGQQIEAEATTSRDAVGVRFRPDGMTRAQFPTSVVDYLLRTDDNVLLDDASAPNQFSADGCLIANHARSILCLPLMKEARLTGLLYLENRRTPNMFTPARVAILKLL